MSSAFFQLRARRKNDAKIIFGFRARENFFSCVCCHVCVPRHTRYFLSTRTSAREHRACYCSAGQRRRRRRRRRRLSFLFLVLILLVREEEEISPPPPPPPLPPPPPSRRRRQKKHHHRKQTLGRGRRSPWLPVRPVMLLRAKRRE